MASHQDLLDAIARVGAATGDREAWQAGLSGEDIAAACSLSSQPTALTAVLTRIVAAHPEAFLPAAGPVSVRPGGGEGLAAEAVRDAETALAQQNSAAARADLQVVTAVLGAHGANADGVARLDRLQREIESAVLSRTDLDTPAGAREFQRFLIGKTRDIRAIVDSAGLDATSKAALATALASLYASATPLPAEASPAMAAESPPAQSVPSDPPIATAARGSAAGLAEPFTGDPPPWGLDDPPPVYEVPGGQIPAPPAAAVSLPAPVPGPAVPATPAPAMAAPGSGWGGGLPGFGGGGGPASPGFSDLGAPGFGGSPEGIRERVGALRRERDSDPPDIPADATTDPMTDEPAPEEPAPEEPAPADPASDDPATVHLPSGETVSAPSAEVAAAMTAALAGTPIPEAFRQQGITIQAPGAAVNAPVALTDVLPGDVGVLADRHALALGNGTALLDNQIQPIGSVIGPGFLGWQHPPAPEATTQTPTTQTPTTQTPEVPAPTRPAETAPS